MDYKVRNGYVLVEPVDATAYDLDPSFRAGSIVVGPDADLGVIVFFQEYDSFNDAYLLVKSEEVKVWINPAPVAPVVEVSADEQQSN